MSADMELYRAVLEAIAQCDAPGLAMFASDDGVIVQFFGCRHLGDIITERFKRRRDQVLHELLMRGFKVRAALAPTTADRFHLLVVGVVK